jgi:hypothetical protein
MESPCDLPKFSIATKFSLVQLNKPWLSGQVKVRHAGECRHPGSFSFNFQNRLDSGFRRNCGNKSRISVDKMETRSA